MNTKLKSVAILSLCVLPFLVGVGCAAMSGGTPPSKFEQVVFTTETNYVDEVVVVEKEVWKTNLIEQVVTKTNEMNVVVKVTNTVPNVVVEKSTVLQTNFNVPKYSFPDTNPQVEADVQALGSVINMFAPGIGGLISGGVLSFLTLWRRLRSYKKTGVVLAQNIEAIRKFIIEILPAGKGQEIDDAIVQFMMREQDKVGAVTTVTDILNRYINSHKTKQDLVELRNAVTSLTKQPS